MLTRTYVCFRSALRSESAQCISHETIDSATTLCGRRVADAESVEETTHDRDPDCRVCMRKARQIAKLALTRDPLQPPFPVGARVRYLGREHITTRVGSGPSTLIKHHGMVVTIAKTVSGRRGTGRQLHDDDGPMSYDDTGAPMLDATRDGYSVYVVRDANGREHGRAISHRDKANWELPPSGEGVMRIAAVALALAGCLPVTRTDVALEAGFVATDLYGWHEDVYNQFNCDDVTPLLNHCGAPSGTLTRAEFYAGVLVVHALVSLALPPAWRRRWQLATTATGVMWDVRSYDPLGEHVDWAQMRVGCREHPTHPWCAGFQ